MNTGKPTFQAHDYEARIAVFRAAFNPRDPAYNASFGGTYYPTRDATIAAINQLVKDDRSRYPLLHMMHR